MNVVEQRKYENLYGNGKEYRQVQPGINFIKRNTFKVMDRLKEAGTKVIEFGSGEGHVIKYLRDKGYDAWGTDIAENSLSFPELEQYKYTCDLGEPQQWDQEFDFIYSCDVFEHLPPESIDNLMENMTNAAPNGKAVVRIALYLDFRGRANINNALHLTVKPVGWWLDKFKKNNIEVLDCSESDRDFINGNVDVYLKMK